VAVGGGYYHSIALKADGTVVAWGRNQYGQCDVPVDLVAVAISTMGNFSLALKADGTVVAWGRNEYGQCDVPVGLLAKTINAGAEHCLAIKK